MSTLIVNAARIRSGGGILHLRQLVLYYISYPSSFDKLFVILPSVLIPSFPDNSRVNYLPSPFEYFLPLQGLWELLFLPRLCKRFTNSVLFNVDAGSLCVKSPVATLSQDMLSFEPRALKTYFPSLNWFRLILLDFVQKRSLYYSDIRIFLTDYARQSILGSNKHLLRGSHIIPHGVTPINCGSMSPIDFKNKSINILYVSPFAPYKHQLEVMKAFVALREVDINVTLTLIGRQSPYLPVDQFYSSLHSAIKSRISIIPFCSFRELSSYYNQAQIGLFASSCENLPITLLELMSSGLPIACSNRGPMPDILKDAGIYFDPQEPLSIASAIYSLIHHPNLVELSMKSKYYSEHFTWNKCMANTFDILGSLCNYG